MLEYQSNPDHSLKHRIGDSPAFYKCRKIWMCPSGSFYLSRKLLETLIHRRHPLKWSNRSDTCIDPCYPRSNDLRNSSSDCVYKQWGSNFTAVQCSNMELVDLLVATNESTGPEDLKICLSQWERSTTEGTDILTFVRIFSRMYPIIRCTNVSTRCNTHLKSPMHFPNPGHTSQWL